jgi:exopolysaccharide production protein ExoQ
LLEWNSSGHHGIETRFVNTQVTLIESLSRERTPLSTSIRFGRASALAELPVSQQLISWLLFWPLLTLIARQAVYFTGPAVSASAYQNGAAMAGARGSHYYLYVDLMILFGFVCARHQHILTVLKQNLLIPSMLVLALCSSLWSASFMITVQMCIEVGLCTLFACYLSGRFRTERLMQLLILMGVAAALLSVAFAVALPSYGVFHGYGSSSWQGICNHKNTLGVSMAFLLTPIFFTKAYGRGRKVVYIGLLLFLIYKSQSRGAWFDTAGMLIFVGWLTLMRKVNLRDVRLLLLVTATASVAGVLIGVHFWPLLAATVGKDATMTGRTAIYSEIWQSIMKRPFFGYGFGGFWYPGSLESQRVGLALGWPNIGYSENGVLELALQIGFVGVALVFAMMGRAICQGVRLLRSPMYTPRVGWFLTIFFLVALTNIDAGWFMTADTLDWVLVIVGCIGMNEQTHGVIG